MALLEKTKIGRTISPSDADPTRDKTGGIAIYQDGFADRKGELDTFPSSIIEATAKEDRVNGTRVVSPADKSAKDEGDCR